MKPWLLIVFLLVSARVVADSSSITIYSYHTDPPFHLPQISTDLTRLFVDHLNAFYLDQNKQTSFKLQRIKRPELNTLVEAGEPYLILWANPNWFKRRDAGVRASSTIFYDADVWISLASKPVQYIEPKDLIGHTFGGRSGYFYKGVADLISNKQTTQISSASDRDNYRLLETGKIDLYVMSRSSLLYWFANGFDTNKVYVAQSPHDAYTRHLLYSKHYDDLKADIEAFLEEIKTNKTWLNKIHFWGVDTLTTPFELELDELINYPLKE